MINSRSLGRMKGLGKSGIFSIMKPKQTQAMTNRLLKRQGAITKGQRAIICFNRVGGSGWGLVGARSVARVIVSYFNLSQLHSTYPHLPLSQFGECAVP